MRTAKPKQRLVEVGVAAPSPRWRPTLKVGVKEIDQQHKTLIRRVTALQEAILGHKPNDEVAAPSPRWRPALKVGIKEIDQQHKTLIGHVTALQAAIAGHKPKDEVAALLAGLIDLVSFHFAWEERLMQSRGYEGYADHQKAHRTLLEQIRALHQEFLSGDVSPSPGIALFIQVWAEHHIGGTDKAFAEFILKSNRKSLKTS
jgi:hemerythrin